MEKLQKIINDKLNINITEYELNNRLYIEYLVSLLKNNSEIFIRKYVLFNDPMNKLEFIIESDGVSVLSYSILNTVVCYLISIDEENFYHLCDDFEDRFVATIIQIDEITLEMMIIKELVFHKQIVSLAESCTGGMIASRLINANGASNVLSVSFITYSNEAKHNFLGVSNRTIKKNTVVSSEVVEEMAKGVLRFSESDIAITISGYAGGSNTNERDGLCFFCIMDNYYTNVEQYIYNGTRNEVREAFTTYILWRFLTLLKLRVFKSNI